MSRRKIPANEWQVYLDALRESEGVQAIACQKTGISRFKVMQWKRFHPEFVTLCDEIEAAGVGVIAEGQLMRGIMNGDKQMIMFYLSRRNPRYRERTESVNANLNFNGTDTTQEQKIRIAQVFAAFGQKVKLPKEAPPSFKTRKTNKQDGNQD